MSYCYSSGSIYHITVSHLRWWRWLQRRMMMASSFEWWASIFAVRKKWMLAHSLEQPPQSNIKLNTDTGYRTNLQYHSKIMVEAAVDVALGWLAETKVASSLIACALKIQNLWLPQHTQHAPNGGWNVNPTSVWVDTKILVGYLLKSIFFGSTAVDCWCSS